MTTSWLGAAKAVARFDDPREVVIVLDDFPDVNRESARHLAALGRQIRPLGAHLVVTTRELSLGGADLLHESQVLDAEDMRLSLSEAALVATAVSGNSVEPNDVAVLCELCAGHPATFVVLLRHATLGPDGWKPRTTAPIDLSARLTYLAATSLGSAERRMLFVMALLGRGSLADIRHCDAAASLDGLARIARLIPLVRLAEAPLHRVRADEFIMHELAQTVFSSGEFPTRLGGFAEAAWPLAVEVLVERGETPRAALIVEQRANEAETASWLLQHGDQVLRLGGSSCLMRMVRQLPVTCFVRSPRLLLVHARLLQEHSGFEEAIEKANVARTIAEQDEDEVLSAEAMLVAGECYSETANYDAALGILNRLVGRPSTSLTHDQKAWAFAAMAGCCLHLGQEDQATAWATAAVSIAGDPVSSASVRSYVLGVAGAIAAVVRGDLAGSLSHFTRAAESAEVPRALQAKAQGNKGVCLCEMGRLDRCIEAVHLALNTCVEADTGVTRGCFLPVEGAALVARGSSEAGLRSLREGIELSASAGDRYQASYNRIYLATALRAVGRIEESLAEAEQALETFTGVASGTQTELATLELAASLLALDDIAAARRAVETVRSSMSGLNLYHLLRADMILAEIERRTLGIDRAVARLMSHEEYVLTESSNWQIAMYCRAFPELLGVFALALDTERLPAHLLRMIPPENAEVVLAAIRELLPPAEWTRLGERLLGREALADFLDRGGRPLCRVKLFGGLEVNVGGRVVSEREWRKRKARLLFRMLVIRGGRDVPRDQVLDHLWPEMDEVRAKNNLYVIWSAMKNALSPEAGQEPSLSVHRQHRRGLPCRRRFRPIGCGGVRQRSCSRSRSPWRRSDRGRASALRATCGDLPRRASARRRLRRLVLSDSRRVSGELRRRHASGRVGLA